MKKYDLIIIGGGAAGLSAALYGARAKLSVLLFDVSGGGGQMFQINDLENYPGVFPAVSGFDLAEVFQKQATHFGAEIKQEEVNSLEKNDGEFFIKTQKDEYTAKAVILATGATHRKLDVKGEAEFTGKGVSYCAICDGAFFRNKHVIVVGGGNSALTETIFLLQFVNRVTLVHRRNEFRADRINVERVLADKRVSIEYDSILAEIKGENKVNSAILENVKSGEKKEIQADGVFVFVGMLPKSELSCGAKKNTGGYIETDLKMRTSVSGLYAVGDVRNTVLRQLVTAASDGAIAAIDANEYIRNA